MTLERPVGALADPIDPDSLTLDGIGRGRLRGRPVTVLGFARSGLALARFLADAGADVTIYDARPAADLGGAIDALGGRPARLLLGPEIDPAAAWAEAALITTSPSINPAFPTTEPRLRAALRGVVERRAAGDRGAPAVVSEPDLFLRLCPAPTIGVTGTKGKTTTSALTYALLATDPEHPAVLGGNIGIPIIERLPELTPRHRVVYELSELQLPTLSRGTTAAVYTNVTADHLDRHGSLAAYQAVKARLAELVDPAGVLILNLEDPIVASYAELPRRDGVRVVGYRHAAPPAGGLGVVDGWIVANGPERLAVAGGGPAETGPDGRIMPLAELRLPGRHNVSNALAATAAALSFGISSDAIRLAAAAFTGVEHRLEPVATIDGVRFINDSQGTQPDAVIAALRAFDRPLVLIAGGRDKGVDLAELGPVAAERATAAVLIGESAPALASLFRAAGLERVERAASLEAAVERADTLAREALAREDRAREDRATATATAAGESSRPVATVLLSPAAASFDMFADYEARGRAFKAAVADLQRRSGGAA